MKGALCLLLTLLAVSILAQPVWPEEVVVRDGQDLHYFGDPVSDSFGNSLISWVKSTHGKHIIYADLIQPNGTSLWRNPVTVRESIQPIREAQVKYGSDNCFIYCWEEYGAQQSTKILLQKLTASGLTLWDEGVYVLDERIQTYYQFETAPNSYGGLYVFYKDESGNVIHGRNYDSSGNEVWGDNAPQIIGSGINFSGIASCYDYGVAIHYRSGDNSTNFITSYAEAGYPQWQQSYSYELGEAPKHDIFVSNDHRVIDAVVITEPITKLKVRLYNSQGTTLLNPPYELVLGNNPLALDKYCLASDGLGLYLLYAPYVNYETEIRYLMITSSFTNAYPAGGLLMGSVNGFPKNLKLSIDNVGCVYGSWIDEGTTSETIMLNMVNGEMQAAWGQGISLFTSESGITDYGIQKSSEGVTALYQHQDLHTKQLTMQIINTQGALQLGPNGQMLASASKYTSEPVATHPIGDRTMVIFYDHDANGNNTLYYQIVSNDGYPVLPQPLRLGQEDVPVLYCKSCIWSGTVAVIYTQGIDYYLQVIGYGGELNMGNPGIYITNQVNGNFKMTPFNSDLYLGWMRNSSPGYKQMVGQRFHNWQWAWGPDAKVLVDNIPATNYYMGASDGAYYTWQGRGPTDTYSKIYCLLVDANGDPYPGWNPNGELIYDNPQDSDQRPIWAKLYGNSLIVLTGGLAPSSLYAIRVNIDNSLPWGTNPIEVADNSVFYLDCDAVDNGFWTIMGGNNAGQRSISLQYLSAEGALQFPAPGIILQSFNDSEGIPEVKMSAYDNGRLLALWMRINSEVDKETYYQTISPQGTPLEDSPRLLSHLPGIKLYPEICMHGNQAIVSFSGFNTDLPQNYNNSFLGIFAQKLNGDFTQVPHEPGAPMANLSFKSCYPNPFSSSATLVWEQKHTETVKISIYNLKGQKVKEYPEMTKDSGEHSLIWNGEDKNGQKAAAGIYFIRMKSGKDTLLRKVVKI